MSRAMIESFFPAAWEWVKREEGLLWRVLDRHLLPVSIAKQCPEVGIELAARPPFDAFGATPSSLRQPILFLFALMGLSIGLLGCLGFRSRRRGKTTRCGFYLSVAFGSFGMMNLSALFLHCLWEAPPSTYPESYPWFWIIDTHMTGVSSVCLAFASAEWLWFRATKDDPSSFPPSKRTGGALFLGWIACQVFGISCILWFLSSGSVPKREEGGLLPPPRSLPLELWYLMTAALAAAPTTLALFLDTAVASRTGGRGNNTRKTSPPAKRNGQILAVAGFLAAASGLALDGFFCVRIRDSLLDFPTATALVFLGCDLAFWGIYLAFPGMEDGDDAKQKTR